MGALTRRSDYSVAEQLYSAPYEFEYYQAIRILTALRPESKSFGESENPKDDPVQIQARISYATPASDLQSIFASRYYDRPPILTINFFGIAGVQGPLPQPYTDMITERLRHRDTAFRDFLDIFNHRHASFWYRLQKKHIVGLDMVPAEETSVGKAILDLAGLNQIDVGQVTSLHSRSILHFTSLLWQRQRTAGGLKKLLEGYFKLPVDIHEYYGIWRKPPPEDWTRLGQTGQHQTLGQTTILGQRTWDETAGVRIHLKQMTWKHYLQHLPGGHGNDDFQSIVLFYAGLNRIIKLHATVDRRQIPPSHLTRELRLGQTSWLTRGQGLGFLRDPEVVLI